MFPAVTVAVDGRDGADNGCGCRRLEAGGAGGGLVQSHLSTSVRETRQERRSRARVCPGLVLRHGGVVFTYG